MQNNYQKRSWPQWLIPTLGSTILTIFIMGTALWFQSVWAMLPSAIDEPSTITAVGEIPYQGQLTDANNTPIAGNYDMKFSLYSQADGGSPVWTEERSGANQVQVTDGRFSIMLGRVTPISQNIVTENHALYLGITIGTDSELTPRVELGNAHAHFVTINSEQGTVVPGPSTRQARKQVDIGEPTIYTVSTTRYHIEATKARVQNTVPLDMNLFNELCKDVDGCTITLGMRDWNDGRLGSVASKGPYRLFYSQTSTHWRLSNTSAQGMDGNAAREHILQAWDCYFTDAEYVNGSPTDNTVQLGLLNWNATFKDPDMVCTLTIDD